MPIDVVATITGAGESHEETGWAIIAGGGLVGVESRVTPPASVPIEFVDWPWRADDPDLDAHLEAVRSIQPRYAVAPDVDADWRLEDVVDVADELDRHAEQVIVVPKQVPPSRVPGRFRLGVPFRQGFKTPIGVNTYPAFRGHGPVHILGGNPNEQLRLRDRFGFDVGSVDSPAPLTWADYGRVFMAAGGSGVEFRDLEVTPIDLDLLDSRADRIAFSVQNMVEAWNDRRITVRARDLSLFDTQGAPHILPPKRSLGGHEIEEYEEALGMPYDEAVAEREAFEREMERDRVRGVSGQRTVQYDLFDPPAHWFKAPADEPEGMNEQSKRRYFRTLQGRGDDLADEVGLTKGALPEPDDDEDDAEE